MTRDELIEAAVGVMVREGGRLAEWHGWRCAYPEMYGECNCNKEVAAEVVDAVLSLIADAIEAQERLPYAMQRYVRHGDAKLVRSFFATDK